VPVPRPRSVAQIVSAPFLATKARLEELIYSGGMILPMRRNIPSWVA
jgi:hypothetical protein